MLVFVVTAGIGLLGPLFRRSGEPLTSVGRVISQLSGWSLLIASCTGVLVAPALEEVLFRGCCFGRFREHGYVVSGMVMSAVLFAIMHGVPILMPVYFLNGLILAWLCHRTGSLRPPFAVHAGWNLLALISDVLT